MAPPSVLPDISPTWGEIGCHHRLRLFSALLVRRLRRGRLISPQVGEMSGRTEGGVVELGGSGWPAATTMEYQHERPPRHLHRRRQDALRRYCRQGRHRPFGAPCRVAIAA
ncbi:MAG: hypothetical protein EOS71_22330 [Mesorhizobium sp.]|nr:hypothetical protein EOA35_03070 [Mesorhizobium sp. M8A.F.Ca.ET.023.01.1.1]RWC71778.1 MAG: hypothetical protein EOS71_22330 [Mesorhizobium sp.]